MGVAGTYTVTTTGYPAPTVTESGTLPSGLTFAGGTNGTATIAGTPAAGTTGSYPVSLVGHQRLGVHGHPGPDRHRGCGHSADHHQRGVDHVHPGPGRRPSP